MDTNNVNRKIITQLNVALDELSKAHSNTYNFEDFARANIKKVEGILETIKVLLE